MPRGASVYDSGFGIHFSPRNAIASFGIEYDFGLGRAATSGTFLFRSPAAASTGLRELKAMYRGRARKVIPADHLGQQRWGLNSQVGLPIGFHFGWRVDNVDLVFSYRGETSPPVTQTAALALAQRMARRVRC